MARPLGRASVRAEAGSVSGAAPAPVEAAGRAQRQDGRWARALRPGQAPTLAAQQARREYPQAGLAAALARADQDRAMDRQATARAACCAGPRA